MACVIQYPCLVMDDVDCMCLYCVMNDTMMSHVREGLLAVVSLEMMTSLQVYIMDLGADSLH